LRYSLLRISNEGGTALAAKKEGGLLFNFLKRVIAPSRVSFVWLPYSVLAEDKEHSFFASDPDYLEITRALAKRAGKCNCNYYTKIRSWKSFIKPEAFKLLGGKDAVTEYRWQKIRLAKEFSARPAACTSTR
jgi:hypothetical protein